MARMRLRRISFTPDSALMLRLAQITIHESSTTSRPKEVDRPLGWPYRVVSSVEGCVDRLLSIRNPETGDKTSFEDISPLKSPKW